MSEINNIKSSGQPTVSNSVRKDNTRGSSSPSDVVENKATNDKVSLTDTATQLQTLRQVISNAPDVNQNRVDSLKAAIADGSYQVDVTQLAKNIVGFEKQLG